MINLHKNKQHFLKFALSFIKDAKNETRFKKMPNVHINRFGPSEELDEHTKLSISIFIDFSYAAGEKTHLLKVFFCLFFPLYRMVLMQRKLPRTARRE